MSDPIYFPYTLTAIDQAGNQATQSLSLRYQPITVTITNPVANSRVNDDLTNIEGQLIAPSGSTVTVNDTPVTLSPTGINETDPQTFALLNVPLAPGANTFTALVTLPSGQTTQQSIQVTSGLTGPATIMWPINPTQAGQYIVKVRWPTGGEASNATYTVTHADGQSQIVLDQRTNGGTWQTLGTYTFKPGLSQYVLLTDLVDGNVLADAIMLEWVGSNTEGDTVSGGGEEFYYIHPDQLGTPRTITNEAQATVWRWDNTDPFGANTPNEDPDGDGVRLVYNLRFPGQYFDQETGLNYNFHRDYDPTNGRYAQSDPIGLSGGLNTYAYVDGNPIRWIDPYGLYDLNFSTGFHVPISPGVAVGPVFSSSIKNYSDDPSNPLVSNPIGTDVAVGVIADAGVSVGVSDLSNSGGTCGGYTVNLGAGRYAGAQITFRQSQDETRSIFNPLRYIDGVSIGLGVGIASPVSVSRGE